MKRILSLAAAAALGLSLLTACGDDGGGSSGSGDYCDDLKAAKKKLDTIKGGDLSTLSETADDIHKLRDEAPDEIKDDWEILSDGFDKIIAAFEKAGLTDEDVAALQSGQLPDDVDMAALQAAMTEIQDLGGEEFDEGRRQHRRARQEGVRDRSRGLIGAGTLTAVVGSQPRLARFRDGCCATSSTTGAPVAAQPPRPPVLRVLRDRPVPDSESP